MGCREAADGPEDGEKGDDEAGEKSGDGGVRQCVQMQRGGADCANPPGAQGVDNELCVERGEDDSNPLPPPSNPKKSFA